MENGEIRDLLISAENRIKTVLEQADGSSSEELQLAAAEIRQCIAHHSEDEKAETVQKTVLFVDDEELIRKIASQMLSSEGYNVITAADGEEGLEIFKAKGHLIKCVILDLVMPGMSGIQVADAINGIDPDAGLILTSGYGEEEIRKRFGSLRKRIFIRKPFSAAVLLETVNRVIVEADRG